MISDFVLTDYLVAPGLGGNNNIKPWLACSGTFGDRYDWNDQAMDNKGNPHVVKREGVGISDIITPIDGLAPTWIRKKSYVLNDKYNAADWCEVYANRCRVQIKDAAITNSGAMGFDEFINGQRVTLVPVSPGIVMCPHMFTEKVNLLADVEWPDPKNQAQINEVMPQGSGTLFHELAHLISYWEATDRMSNAPVSDISYDVQECLELAARKLPGIASERSSLNAETYLFLAFSYLGK